MKRHRNQLGLALVAMLALGAFAAQGASASPLTVEGGIPTVFTSGDQDGGTTVLTTPGGTVSCAEVSYTGSGAVVSGENVEATVVGSYPTEKSGGGNNCTAFGFAGTHIKTNECTYTMTTPTKIEAGAVTWSGSTQLHLNCPTGKAIEITPTTFGVSVCTQLFAPQTPTLGHIVGKNAGTAASMDITIEITLEGIHYTGTGGPCGPVETHSDAKVTGKSTVRCFKNSGRTEQTGCTVS